ncbi:transporter substrate-binding domain-containing protein [Undibacterium arcticum]
MNKLVTLLVLAGVLSAPAVQAKEWKEVTIAMDATYPPFESVGPDGKLVGFEVDLANALCVEMKVKCKIVNVGWDGLIPGLVAKKHDALMTSMNITEERKKRRSIFFRHLLPHAKSLCGQKKARTLRLAKKV